MKKSKAIPVHELQRVILQRNTAATIALELLGLLRGLVDGPVVEARIERLTLELNDLMDD